jgi:hypothetical protein
VQFARFLQANPADYAEYSELVELAYGETVEELAKDSG